MAVHVAKRSEDVSPLPPGDMFPIIYPAPIVIGVTNPGALAARFVRGIAPRTGTLQLFAYIGTTSVGGDVLGMVYDVGEESAGDYSLLWDGGAIDVPAVGWKPLGSGLIVAQGQQVFMGICFSDATAQFGRGQTATAAATVLDPAMLPDEGNNSGKLGGARTFATHVAEATIAEADMLTTATNLPLLVGVVA